MNTLYFAQIREDGALEMELCERYALRRVLTIASGGCTALSLLSQGVEQVFAIDANPAQVALVELRVAAIRELERDEYLTFIGDAPATNRLVTYRLLSQHLSSAARTYWDALPELVDNGIGLAGATERFYRFVGDNLCGLVGNDVILRLLAAPNLAAQQALVVEHFSGPAWNAALRVLLSRTSHLQFFPAFMFAQATEHDFGNFFRKQFESAAMSRLLTRNYFLSQLFFGRYLAQQADGIPAYLTREGYTRTRANLGALTLRCASLEETLPTLSALDGVFLSNVFDWANEQTRKRIAVGVAGAARSGARVLLRHMLAVPKLPSTFQTRLRLDDVECERFTQLERSLLYQAVRSGELS